MNPLTSSDGVPSKPATLSLKLATLEDAPVLERMSIEFFHKSPQAYLGCDEDKIKEIVQTFITGDKTAFITVCLVKNEEVVGVLAALAAEMLFNRKKITSEAVLWIDEAHRSPRGFKMLREAYEFWAAKIKSAKCQVGHQTDPESMRVAPLYKRAGYRLEEMVYVKDIKCA
jgi:hypothetical protein